MSDSKRDKAKRKKARKARKSKAFRADKPAQPVAVAVEPPVKQKQHPFRRALLRGLGVVMPPLLTIVLLLWLWNMVQNYVLTPVGTGLTYAVAWSIQEEAPSDDDIKRQRVENGVRTGFYNDEFYHQIENGDWVKRSVYDAVSRDPGGELYTGTDYYHRYVAIQYLKPSRVLPVFLSIFVLVLYFLGKFMAAGVGRIVWATLERVIDQLPIVRNIYSSVKQVTDFVFKESEVGFTRVVAIQYPRHGIWTVAFVTGESMLDIRSAANEPVVSLLIPTSPVPATGFSITVLKSETVDLDITVDQAVQFMVSCGVVVPPSQMYEEHTYAAKIAAALERASHGHLAPQIDDQKRGLDRQPSDPDTAPNDQPPTDPTGGGEGT